LADELGLTNSNLTAPRATITDIKAQSIGLSDGVSGPLMISDSVRGVELTNIKNVNLFTDMPITDWNGLDPSSVSQRVKHLGLYYVCLVQHRNLEPNTNIPNFNSSISYDTDELVFVPGGTEEGTYRCRAAVTSPVQSPATDNINWELVFRTNSGSEVWGNFNPFASNITGDIFSTLTIGAININGYKPPLRIYKNATIGSAVSRGASTSEVQLYSQEMTLKATTQYLLNLSYSGLTENTATTPNLSFYIYYKIHAGTTPLDDTNIVGIVQFTNTTGYAGNGASSSFMTTTAGTYTGRFYVRNTSATIALTIENLQASVTEIF
jgi:hypothetical protein